MEELALAVIIGSETNLKVHSVSANISRQIPGGLIGKDDIDLMVISISVLLDLCRGISLRNIVCLEDRRPLSPDVYDAFGK